MEERDGEQSSRHHRHQRLIDPRAPDRPRGSVRLRADIRRSRGGRCPLQRPQVDNHILHVLIAVVGVLRQRLADVVIQLDGNPHPYRCDRRRLPVDNRVQHRLLAIPLERQSPRDHFIKQHAQRPDVGAAVGWLAFGLLGRHARDGPHYGLCFCQPRSVGQTRQPKIENLHLPLWGEHEVRTLDVAVDNVPLVRGLQPLSGLHGDVEGFVEFERAGADLFVEAPSLDVGHGDEHLPAGLVDFVNGANVCMIDRRRGLGFAAEAFFRRGVFGEVRSQELQRDGSIEVCIESLVDDAHAAFAEFFE